MNRTALAAHSRLLHSDLPRRTHQAKPPVVAQGYRRPLTPELRGEVIRLRKEGHAVPSVATMTNLGRSTVERILKQAGCTKRRP